MCLSLGGLGRSTATAEPPDSSNGEPAPVGTDPAEGPAPGGFDEIETSLLATVFV